MKVYKKIMSCTLATGLALSMTACGNGQYAVHEKGVANTDTSQTEFSTMGRMSALSKGYDDNVVLYRLRHQRIRMERAGG